MLRSSYGILIRMNVILTSFATETVAAMATETDTERWKPDVARCECELVYYRVA